MGARTNSRVVILIVGILCIGVLAGCGSGTTTQPPPPPPLAAKLTVSVSHSGNFQLGQQGAVYTITVSNTGQAATAGNVQVIDTLPSGETLVSMSGTGWTSPGGSVATRTDALAVGQSWPPITMTVNVAANASSPQVNMVGVAGGGGGTANAQDSTTIVPAGPAIVVTVIPAAVDILVRETVEFGVTVQNDPKNSGVTWSIGTSGCSPAACGSIDATGKYTAPSSVPANCCFIVATSVADPTKSANGYVNVHPGPAGIGVSPSAATVPANGSQQFTATDYLLDTPPYVTWNLSGAGCSGATCGTIDSKGNYTAPAAPPNPPTVTVTAAYALDGSISGSASVNIGGNPDNAKLNGHYAFRLQGFDLDGDFSMAGSFTADGNGHITDGVGDFNMSSDYILSSSVSLTGTYSVGPDGLGAVTLSTAPGAIFGPSSQTFAIALGSFSAGVATQGQITEIDDVFLSNGALARQDPTAFSSAAISGSYAFRLTGTADTISCCLTPGQGFGTTGAMSAVGRFTAGGGSFSAGAADVYTQTEVLNGGCCAFNSTYLSDLLFGGAYSDVSANGRGTVTLTFPGQSGGFYKFSFYVVSANELFMFEIDEGDASQFAQCPPLGVTPCTIGNMNGVALRQSVGPFSAGSLNGPAVSAMTDNSVANNLGVSLMAFDGVGAVIGETDTVNGADGAISAVPVSGTYTVDPSGIGRGVLTFSGDSAPRPFYIVNPGEAFILDSASGQVARIESQSGGPFTNASLSGTYVLKVNSSSIDGSAVGFAGSLPNSGVGLLTSDAAGNITGTVDSADGNGAALGATFTASYSIAVNGRGTLTSSPNVGTRISWILYIVSPSKALLRQAVAQSALAMIEK